MTAGKASGRPLQPCVEGEASIEDGWMNREMEVQHLFYVFYLNKDGYGTASWRKAARAKKEMKKINSNSGELKNVCLQACWS